MRLIDADALEKELTEKIAETEKDGEFFDAESFDRAREIIIDEPTVCDIEQIRADIYELWKKYEYEYESYADGLNQALAIIDKYMKGGEK